MLNNKNKLIEIQNILEKWPLFIFNKDFTYNEIKYFLYGFLMALGTEEDFDHNSGFTNWLSVKYNRKTSFLWMEYIYIILANNNQKRATKFLISEFKNYIDSIE